MRDLALVELARPFAEAARAALAHIPNDAGQLASRLETMDLFLSLARHNRDDASGREHVESFLVRATDNLRAVLPLEDKAAPATSLLANAMQHREAPPRHGSSEAERPPRIRAGCG